MRWDVKRRTVLSMLLASSGISIPLGKLWAQIPSAHVKDALARPLPKLNNLENPEFDVFFRLSQLVCLRVDLDVAVARRIYALIEVEPWGLHHVSALYALVLANLDTTGLPRPFAELIEEGRLGEGEAWFTRHLMTTWYLGIYYHESRPEPVRVSFETSLMWEALRGQVTPPGFSQGAIGDWNLPPEHAR
ncbi:sugar dehydrogenase complex small subunit [Pseudophaeobacter sp.]|uniref:sugar dehydrogenase complex small subunit n=1 Tax=Pseudophaeobacter sp. TaxID=1971739 RepID=UPI0032986F62